jgi:hypothetical protein
MWKKMALNDDGEKVPVSPHYNIDFVFFAIDIVFTTMAEADKWLADAAEDWGILPEESDDWVLVKYTETIMPQGVQP